MGISNVIHGLKAGSTDAALISATSRKYEYIYFKANPSNTGTVFIGSSDVAIAGTTDSNNVGFPLAAGDVLPIDGGGDLNHLYYITTTSGDELMYIGFTRS